MLDGGEKTNFSKERRVEMMNMLPVTPKGQEVKLDSKGRISVPVSVRRNMRLEPGKVFEVLTTNEGVLIYRLVS